MIKADLERDGGGWNLQSGGEEMRVIIRCTMRKSLIGFKNAKRRHCFKLLRARE